MANYKIQIQAGQLDSFFFFRQDIQTTVVTG